MRDDVLRDLARELLDADEALHVAPTKDNTARLTPARRQIEQALTGVPGR